MCESRHSSAEGPRVLAAVSGGPDSTALLLMLREQGVDVVAAHYDHALQPASAAVAEHVARTCRELGVELISERRSKALPKGSVQAAARELRYDFLERAATQVGAMEVALAHTADDVVEGALLHLLRGAGIAGLRGMPARRGKFVRPLLDTWRRDIRAYLDERGVVPLDDPANTDRRHARVRVRLDLLPALERDRPGITRRLHAAARRAAVYQEDVERAATAVIQDGSISAAELGELPEPVAAEALELLYGQAGGRRPALVRRHLDAMLRLAAGRGGRGVDLPGGLRFRVAGQRARISPRVTASMDARLAVRDCPGCEAEDAVHLRPGLNLSVGHRRPGLRLRPAAGRGTRKLQDLFVDAKVPREERDGWPLVFAGEQLAWVPGLAVDRELRARPGEPALHVTVVRILAAGRTPQSPMLKSPDIPRGESS